MEGIESLGLRSLCFAYIIIFPKQKLGKVNENQVEFLGLVLIKRRWSSEWAMNRVL